MIVTDMSQMRPSLCSSGANWSKTNSAVRNPGRKRRFFFSDSVAKLRRDAFCDFCITTRRFEILWRRRRHVSVYFVARYAVLELHLFNTFGPVQPYLKLFIHPITSITIWHFSKQILLVWLRWDTEKTECYYDAQSRSTLQATHATTHQVIFLLLKIVSALGIRKRPQYSL